MMDPEYPLETETLESLKKELKNARRSYINSKSARKAHLGAASRLTDDLADVIRRAKDADSDVRYFKSRINDIEERIDRRMEKE